MAAMLTVIVMIVICALVYLMPRKRKAKILFTLIYNIYVTRFGLFFHKRQLSAHKVQLSAGKKPPRHEKVVKLEGGVSVYVLPYLSDNFAYLLLEESTCSAVVIDPAGPDEVMLALRKTNARLEGILCTHKHWDHSGGNGVMMSSFPDVPIYSSKLDSAYKSSKIVLDREHIPFGALHLEAIFTPGHTKGHMSYLLPSNDGRPPCLFTGDHIFVGGCGQLFECSPDVMVESLKTVSRLPPETLLFPGHDYAVPNLQFVTRLVEPESERARSKLKAVLQLAAEHEPAVPAALAEEVEYNPFLRLHHSTVRASARLLGDSSDGEVLLELRRMKANLNSQPVWY